MLRTREQVRVLGPGDRDSFVALAEQDPVVNVFADYRARLTNLDERWLGGQVWGRFDGDELVSGLLMIHDLYPVPIEERIMEALDTVRPYMESHGGNVELLGIDSAPDRFDLDRSEELRTTIAEAFAARTQKEWTEVFEGTDACVAPVLPLTEAMEHPHMSAREVFVEREGVRQPAPAPRFSRTTATLGRAPAEKPGIDTRAALEAWGIGGVDDLIERGVAVQA